MSAISFLSDYGRDDDFVGVCHGVMARIAPEVRVLDVTHGIARHDVRAGALVLRNTLPYMPPGVHLAVVDPELRVRGLEGLSIADGSIFPSMPTVNPVVGTFMVGEKAADLVRAR